MSVVIPDPSTVVALRETHEVLELRAPDGHLLGHFVPALDVSDPRLQPQISEEEVERRERKGGGRPLAGILSDLEKRA